jgi:hypothetical protein
MNKKQKTYISIKKLIFIALIFTGSIRLNAQIFDPKPDQEDSPWSLTLSPYALFASQATDVGGEAIRQSFNDLSSLTNSGFQMSAILGYKRWLFSFDGTWANLGASQNGNLLNLDLDIDQQILDMRLGYVVFENLETTDNDVIKSWHMGVNMGAKYWLNDVRLDYKFSALDGLIVDEGSLIEKQEWWDFMLGIAPTFHISRTVTISAQASIGGFGIGNASKLAYDWTFLNSFKVTKPLAVHVGFRNFYYSREDGEGSAKVETNVNVIGPFLGVSLLIL